LLGRLYPQRCIDIDGDGETDYKLPRPVVVYYSINLVPSLLLNIIVQIFFSALFCAVEGWTFPVAAYHCFVTATTVGYGDIAITTNGGRMLAVVHILLSVVLLAEMVNTIDTLRSDRAAQQARIKQLERRLDGNLIEQLMVQAKTLRPHVERDGLGLTELEYAMAMLLELEIVTWSQVRPFIKQFRKLNVTGDGRLGENDLKVCGLASRPDYASLAKNFGPRRGSMAVGARKMRQSVGAGPHSHRASQFQPVSSRVDSNVALAATSASTKAASMSNVEEGGFNEISASPRLRKGNSTL